LALWKYRIDTSQMASDPSSPSLHSATQLEQQRIKDVKSSFQILHRWTDTSCGAGFDVLVFPKCVIVLDPKDPASSKTIVFSQDSKVYPFYTKKAEDVAREEENRRDASADSRKVAAEVTAATATPSAAQKHISELRICVRDSSIGREKEDIFQLSPNDIVLRWLAANDK
jgi:hypothetical protein